MALKTTEEQLEEVQAAITEVLTSQELKTGNNTHVVRANLASLRMYERELLERLGRKKGPVIATGLVRR